MAPMNPYHADNGLPRGASGLPGSDALDGSPTLASRTAEQVHEILRAADQQAVETRRQVELWATARVREIEEEGLRQLDDAKARSDALVAERLDPVMALTAAVEEHAERLISLLEETDWIKAQLRDLLFVLRGGSQAAAEPGTDGSGPTAPQSARLPDWLVAKTASHAPEPETLPDQRDDEGLRLLSLQMAMQGSTRSEVERRLCDEFGARRPQAILDEVFGAGTPGSHRIAWNAVNGTG